MTFCFGGLPSTPVWLVFFFSSVAYTLAMTIPRSSPQVTHFHIQFDGCFRPPRDPGFPTIPHRKAVCAACIGRVVATKDGNDHEPETVPLAMGAREVPVSIETTSQHAEYEGLLMGLEWLIEFVSDQKEPDDSGVLGLTIEGDCKTVIDQLTGKSNPRKLETLHRRAEALLGELNSTVATLDSNSNAQERFRAEFCHIPRNQNPISDGLCNNFMSILDAKLWVKSIQALEQAERSFVEEGRLSPSLSTVFNTAVQTTRFSLRPYLYELVAKLAVETKNYELLIHIGERMVEEESSLQGIHNKKLNSSASNESKQRATLIRKTGINYQIRGWEGLKKPKKAKFLQRKYRVLLSSNNIDTNESIGDVDKAIEGLPLIEDAKEVEVSIHQKLKNLDTVTKGKWNADTPDVWRPMLNEWFASACCERVQEVEGDTFSPVWVVDDAI